MLQIKQTFLWILAFSCSFSALSWMYKVAYRVHTGLEWPFLYGFWERASEDYIKQLSHTWYCLVVCRAQQQELLLFLQIFQKFFWHFHWPHHEYLYICILNSAVKRLIAINRIQNKSFCLHNICVCSVYIYYVYKNTHTHTVYFEYIYMYSVSHRILWDCGGWTSVPLGGSGGLPPRKKILYILKLNSSMWCTLRVQN